MILIHDGMSTVRARLERDMSRFSIRQWLREIDNSKDSHFWVWDGVGNKASRQAIYPGYKANRKPADSTIFEGINLFKKALTHTKAAQITVPNLEADDIIAALAAMMAGGAKPVSIETRDFDLRALTALGDNISCTAKVKPNVSDVDIRVYKTFVGDPSDNVKGVKLFGDTAWGLCNPDTLREIVLSPTVPEDLLEHLPKDCQRHWVRENFDELKAMWAVTGFLPVSKDLINQNLVVGKSDPQAIDALLKDFFL